uniref:Cell division cycle protein 48, putative / CDC48, putative n=1 Tax=Arundo donax TaxID=35708 RepID=A0A0A9D275_ARUDO
MDRNHITKSHPQVLSDDLVHPNLRLLTSFISKHNTNCVFPLLTLEQDSVTAEELEPLHGVRVERDDGVVVINGLVDHQPVRRLLPLKNRRREVLFPLRIGGRGLALTRHGGRIRGGGWC